MKGKDAGKFSMAGIDGTKVPYRPLRIYVNYFRFKAVKIFFQVMPGVEPHHAVFFRKNNGQGGNAQYLERRCSIAFLFVEEGTLLLFLGVFQTDNADFVPKP